MLTGVNCWAIYMQRNVAERVILMEHLKLANVTDILNVRIVKFSSTIIGKSLYKRYTCEKNLHSHVIFMPPRLYGWLS
jgi:hypothetical protein